MRYCLGPPDAYAPIWAALAFMPFGLFFDFMDGKVARWRKKSSLMGQELDSLADLVRRQAFFAHSLPTPITVQNKIHFQTVYLIRIALSTEQACTVCSQKLSVRTELMAIADHSSLRYPLVFLLLYVLLR